MSSSLRTFSRENIGVVLSRYALKVIVQMIFFCINITVLRYLSAGVEWFLVLSKWNLSNKQQKTIETGFSVCSKIFKHRTNRYLLAVNILKEAENLKMNQIEC